MQVIERLGAHIGEVKAIKGRKAVALCPAQLRDRAPLAARDDRQLGFLDLHDLPGSRVWLEESSK